MFVWNRGVGEGGGVARDRDINQLHNVCARGKCERPDRNEIRESKRERDSVCVLDDERKEVRVRE